MEIKGYDMPEDLYYHPDHYWCRMDGDVLVMGMDDFAHKLAGEIVYVQLPFEGKKVQAGKKFAKVESGKWVGKIMGPVDGEMVEANSALETNPKLINQDCYGAGWMYKIKPENPGDLEKLIHGEEKIMEWLLQEIEKYE